MWYGADPGGKNSFGVAALADDGTFSTLCCSSVDEAVAWMKEPSSIGIDCPMWWSSGVGGGREVDRWLRQTYRIGSGTVQSVNSLRGAALVQGVMLAIRVKEKFGRISISETHPKALLKALRLMNWNEIASHFRLRGVEPLEHERDALLGAVVVREADQGRWTHDLSERRGTDELDPKTVWYGPVAYWWPDAPRGAR